MIISNQLESFSYNLGLLKKICLTTGLSFNGITGDIGFFEVSNFFGDKRAVRGWIQGLKAD